MRIRTYRCCNFEHFFRLRIVCRGSLGCISLKVISKKLGLKSNSLTIPKSFPGFPLTHEHLREEVGLTSRRPGVLGH
jgi:hypothetical protein